MKKVTFLKANKTLHFCEKLAWFSSPQKKHFNPSSLLQLK